MRPFLDSAEQATPPAALVGENLVAFLSGSGRTARRCITIATMPEGRIVRRLEATRGIAPQGLVASPDGRTLYYVNAGSLFCDRTSREAPRANLRPANGVALDPRGPSPALVVQVNDGRRGQALPVPLDGSSELSILFASPLRWRPSRSPARPSGPTAGSR